MKKVKKNQIDIIDFLLNFMNLSRTKQYEVINELRKQRDSI